MVFLVGQGHHRYPIISLWLMYSDGIFSKYALAYLNHYEIHRWEAENNYGDDGKSIQTHHWSDTMYLIMSYFDTVMIDNS